MEKHFVGDSFFCKFAANKIISRLEFSILKHYK